MYVQTIRTLRDNGSNDDNVNGWIKKLTTHERELLDKAKEKIIECYAKKNSSLVEIVKDCLLVFELNE